MHSCAIYPDRIPTINPSNGPTTVPGNSSLARPLAHPSYLCELIIKMSPIYSLYSWLPCWIHTGNSTYQPHALFTYTHPQLTLTVVASEVLFPIQNLWLG